MNAPMLVLASKSKARRSMLEAAGVILEAQTSYFDEDALRRKMKADGAGGAGLAAALAEAKAVQLSRDVGSRLVLGGDQILVLEDGVMLDKPIDQNDAKDHLGLLSGNKHQLFSAAVIAEQGSVVWRHVDSVTLTMRDLSDAFIKDYVEAEWDNIRHCVGCYEIERLGAQLFKDISGSQFTIMGLPLLQILEFLRGRGVLLS